MFGYIKPLKPELKIREYDYYKANYCGLCNALRVRCGFMARFIVNYDFTFVSILLAYAQKAETPLVKKRCLVCPTGRQCVVSDISDRIADISVILTYLKFCDDISDNGFFKSFFKARLPRLFIKPAYRRARKIASGYALRATELYKELSELEKNKTPSIDETADKFALMLSSIIEGEDGISRILREILYHIGRFVYIIDALDDFREDMLRGEYNPIASRFEIASEKLPFDICEEVVATLNLSRRAVLSAFELLETNENTGLIRNIIELGMANTIATVMKKEK